MKLNRNQMELGLAVPARCRNRRVTPVRDGRARWWFEQMRRAVESTPPPEEVYLVSEAKEGTGSMAA